MRYIFLIVLAAAIGGFLVYRELMAPLPIVLPAPVQVQAQAQGATLSPDGWTNSRAVSLVAMPRTAASAGLDAEVRLAGQRFTGAPTSSDSATVATSTIACAGKCGTRSDPSITVHLPDGTYHWRVRLHGTGGVSPWVAFPGVLHVDTTPPTMPSISSSTDPKPGTLYHCSTLSFAWTSTDSGSGIQGYSYRLDTNPHGAALADVRTPSSSVTLNGLNTGTYYFHARALDRAGNWGPSATFPVRIDVTPPGLAHVLFNEFQFNPRFDPLRVSFAVTKAATTVRVGVYRQGSAQLVRLYTLSGLHKGQSTAVYWHGNNNSGQPVPPGQYMIYIRAIDRYGHATVTGWRDFVVNYQRILVSLSQQKLWAYDENRLFLTSLVTTGNRALPTPTGIFHILGKFHPFTFHSPWPKSSPFWYPPSLTQWSMLFQAGGYFIHDAPWRSAFGPGTNAQLGTPGSNYTGTHGCVNVPTDVAQKLFAWASDGTVVQIVN